MFSMLPKSVAGCRGFVKASSISTSICLSKALPATKTAWHYVAGCSSNVLSNRSYATSVVTQTSQGKKEPEKSVFISQSNDIYTNLALEDWILNSKNFDFENHRILLLYRNAPCVVFGSFQNPWTEVDLALAQEYDLPVVRRKSGGGCVYHDLGNLNCTFFSSDKTFDVKNSPIPNLEMICRALKREFGIDGVVTPNKDITVNGRKISGTAARKGKSAYHHCTVLINADLTKLSAMLNPNTEGILSRATKSTRSPVQNLALENSKITFDKVMNAIGYEFLRSDKNGNDGGEKMIESQRGFQFLNPSNEWFPGIGQIRSELESWEHIYGRTPEFTVNREYCLNAVGVEGDGSIIKLLLKVTKGRVVDAVLELPVGYEQLLEKEGVLKLQIFANELKGQPFHFDLIRDFEAVLFRQDAQVSSNMQHRDISEPLLIV